ncbi:MAG: hemerythrin domain-containing protein [Pyrinomonadaceae bacterium]
MDAFELLKNDHRKVSQLFEELESASGQQKTQLFSRLKGELDLHAHIEEKIFYPALENTEAAREITLEAYEEHKVVKDLLAELAGGGAPNDEWDAKLTVLKENVEHHVDEEEGELFSKARQALTRDQIERFGVEMEAEKARRQGGAPRQSAAASTNRDSQSASQKGEGPGVLQRIASLVGLGDSETTGSRKRGGTTKRATARKASGGTKKQAAKSATRKTATKKTAATKSGPRKSASKGGSKRGSTATAKRASKRSTAKSSKRQASVGARSSARKTAGRGAAKKGGRSSAKRSRAK